MLAGVLPGATSLVASIGQVIIDNQPPGAKDVVVSLFGTNDKLAFELIIVAIALVDRRRSRRPRAPATSRLAATIFAAFGVLGFAASLNDPLANPGIEAASAAISVGLGLWVLGWLLGPPRGRRCDDAVWRRAATARAAAAAVDARLVAPLVHDPGGSVTAAAVVAGFVGRNLLERQRVAPAGAGAAVPPASVIGPAAGRDPEPAHPRSPG